MDNLVPFRAVVIELQELYSVSAKDYYGHYIEYCIFKFVISKWHINICDNIVHLILDHIKT
jgi:hypothetical protein